MIQIDWYFALELLGFLLNLVYLYMIIKQRSAGWIFGLAASFLFMMVCFSTKLYIQSALYFFYVVIGIIGFLYWRSNENLPVSRFSPKYHGFFLLVATSFGILLGWLTSAYTDQSQPFLDGMISSFAVAATVLIVRKYRENWIYWIPINGLSIFLYLSQDLYMLALMSVILLVFATYGLREWYLNA